MDFVGKAKRIRIYLAENDVIGHKPTPYALLDWLRREGAAGATGVRAAAGPGRPGPPHPRTLPGLPGRPPGVRRGVDSPGAGRGGFAAPNAVVRAGAGDA